MPLSTIQTSFARGEITPELAQRIDLAAYTIGAKKIENMCVLPQGGVQSRTGTYFTEETKNSAQKSRLVDFVFSTTQAYMLEFGDHYIRFYMNGGTIVKTLADTSAWNSGTTYAIASFVQYNSKIYRSLQNTNLNHQPDTSPTYWIEDDTYEVYSPYGINDIWQLKTEQSADMLYITHKDYQTRKLTRTGHTSWTFSLFDFKNGPLLKENATNTTLKVLGYLQRSRPSSDISTTGWTAGYASIDEDTASDSDFISCNTIDTYNELGLETIQTPSNKGGHVLMVRAGNVVVNLTIKLFQGATEIKSWQLRTKTKYTTYNLYLTAVEAANITNYSDLRVKLASNAISVRVSWVQFHAPLPEGDLGASGVAYNDIDLYEGSSAKLVASSSIFTSDHIGAYFAIRYVGQSKTFEWITPNRGANVYSPIFTALGDWTITLDISSMNEADMYLEKSMDDGATWYKAKKWPATDATTDILLSGSEDKSRLFRFYREDDPTGGDIVTCTADITGTEQYAYFKITSVVDGQNAIVTLTSDFNRPNVEFKTWAEGAWSDLRGWPSTVSFYQNRLVFGNNGSEPFSYWVSVTDDYENMEISLPQVTDDAITDRLPGRMVNAIKYFVPLSDLIAFTGDSEWSIGPGNDGILAYNSRKNKQQTYWGCADVRPVIMGNTVIFAERGGAKVRSIGYSYEVDGYTGNDLSVMAKHLFDGYTITDWAYQQTPNSILWVVRSDGMLLSFTFHKEHEVWAWARHVTQGEFESVSTIPGTTNDEVYFIVKRTINGATKRFVERLAQRDVSSKSNFFGVDCGLTYSGTATSTITGLTHLNGMTVTVLADGSLYTKVVANGSITLNAASTKVHVGLGFNWQLDTLRTDINNSADKKELIEGATICVKDSYGGKIGVNQFVDIKPPSNDLYTAEVSTGIISGWNKNGGFTVKGNGAHPTHITAIIPRQTVGGA
jgi:hypothetical protein